eukprot:1579577-Pleurochrysis_carterae.AAC.1
MLHPILRGRVMIVVNPQPGFAARILLAYALADSSPLSTTQISALCSSRILPAAHSQRDTATGSALGSCHCADAAKRANAR